MSWYKNNKTEWKEIIDAVSTELKRNPLMVEKDTIQSMFLYKISFYNGSHNFLEYLHRSRFSFVLFRVVQHACTDAVFAPCPNQYIMIAAAFASFPEGLVIGQVGKCYG